MARTFAFYNLETTALAHHGKKNDFSKYINRLKKADDAEEDNNINEQFEGINFV